MFKECSYSLLVCFLFPLFIQNLIFTLPQSSLVVKIWNTAPFSHRVGHPPCPQPRGKTFVVCTQTSAASRQRINPADGPTRGTTLKLANEIPCLWCVAKEKRKGWDRKGKKKEGRERRTEGGKEGGRRKSMSAFLEARRRAASGTKRLRANICPPLPLIGSSSDAQHLISLSGICTVFDVSPQQALMRLCQKWSSADGVGFCLYCSRRSQQECWSRQKAEGRPLFVLLPLLLSMYCFCPKAKILTEPKYTNLTWFDLSLHSPDTAKCRFELLDAPDFCSDLHVYFYYSFTICSRNVSYIIR